MLDTSAKMIRWSLAHRRNSTPLQHEKNASGSKLPQKKKKFCQKHNGRRILNHWMNKELLLLFRKHTGTLIEQTKSTPQKTLDFRMNEQLEIFSVNPPINLFEEGKRLLVVTSYYYMFKKLKKGVLELK